MNLTVIDGIVVLTLLGSTLLSLVRGLVREVLSLAAWIAAFVLASRTAQDAAAWLPSDWQPAALRVAIGFAAVLLVVRLAGSLLTWAIDVALRAGGLKPVDRTLGAVFGLARGGVVVLALAVLAGLTQVPQQAVWQNAFTTPWIMQGVQTIKPLLPDQLAQSIRF